MKNNIFIICDCYSHGLYIEKNKEDNEFYINMFERGFTGRDTSWKEKLILIWKIIKTGHPYTDMIVLNDDKAKELVTYLKNNLNT